MNVDTGLHINDFPDSVLLKILSYLEQVELHLSVSWVCKRWNDLCYDRYLWTHFSLLKYEEGFNGNMDYQIDEELVDTRGFQRYILQCVHTYVKQISLSCVGIIYIPFLNEIELQSLERLSLPYPYITDYTEENMVLIQAMHKSTSAMICTWNSCFGPVTRQDWPLCYKTSKVVISDDASGTNIHTITTDWSQVAAFLKENPGGHFVSLHCEREVTDKHIPPEIFRLLGRMETLQQLQISGCSLQKLDQLHEAELNHLCSNLISLKLHSIYTTGKCISNLISRAHSLRYLYLCLLCSSSPLVIPHSYTQLTELHIVGYTHDTSSSTCHFCDIALVCEKLRKVALGPEVVLIKLNTFLHNLSEKCKDLVYLSVKHCKDRDTLAEYTYKDGLGELLGGCPKLKYLELVSPNIGGYPSLNFNPPKYSNDNLLLEELRLGRVNNRFWKPPLQTVGKMRNLTRLSISNLKSGFVPVEFIDALSRTCSKITHLALVQPCKGLSNIGPAILDHIHMDKLQLLILERYFSFSTDGIVKLIKRCASLEELNLTPVDETAVSVVESELNERPHRITKLGLKMRLVMLSKIRWKQLTAPQWKETWRSKVVIT